MDRFRAFASLSTRRSPPKARRDWQFRLSTVMVAQKSSFVSAQFSMVGRDATNAEIDIDQVTRPVFFRVAYGVQFLRDLL
jgi:hypothetical protein